jgi:hypothetical protein
MEFSMLKWQELCSEMVLLEEDFYKRFDCEVVEFTEERLKANKETRTMSALYGSWIVRFADMHHKTKGVMIAAAGKVEELASSVDNAQVKIIALQDDLIKSKEDQLASVRTTVREEVASVQSAVQTEIRSWSEIARQKTAQQPISTARIKEAVKSAVIEEDKSRNLLIFGKPEVDNEDVAATVSEILLDTGEKPHLVECRRIGAPGADGQDKRRPIKVKLSSSDAVLSILRNASALKNSTANKLTFLGPDRTTDERLAHKKLVEFMRRKMEDEPESYHYIRGGLIRSVKKS